MQNLPAFQFILKNAFQAEARPFNKTPASFVFCCRRDLDPLDTGCLEREVH